MPFLWPRQKFILCSDLRLCMHDNAYDRYEKEEFCHFFVLKNIHVYLWFMRFMFILWFMEVRVYFYAHILLPSNYWLFCLFSYNISIYLMKWIFSKLAEKSSMQKVRLKLCMLKKRKETALDILVAGRNLLVSESSLIDLSDIFRYS